MILYFEDKRVIMTVPITLILNKIEIGTDAY